MNTTSIQSTTQTNYFFTTIYDAVRSLADKVADFYKRFVQWVSSFFAAPQKIDNVVPLRVDQKTNVPVEATPIKKTTPIKLATIPTNEVFLNFYRGTGRNTEGRTFEEILSWNHKTLENTHNYIQWLFPNLTQGKHNPTAPVLNDEIIQAFKDDQTLKTNLAKAFLVMLRFYGFGLQSYTLAMVTEINDSNSNTFLAGWYNFMTHDESMFDNWLNDPSNHNLLRITRMLLCLSTLGYSNLARSFLQHLERIYLNEGNGIISDKTMDLWKKACPQNDNPIHLPQEDEIPNAVEHTLNPAQSDQINAYEIVRKAIPLVPANIKRETQLTMQLLGTKSIGASEWEIDLSNEPEHPKITEEQIKKLLEENPLLRKLTVLVDPNLKETWSPDFKAINQYFQASLISKSLGKAQLLIEYRRNCDSLESAITRLKSK